MSSLLTIHHLGDIEKTDVTNAKGGSCDRCSKRCYNEKTWFNLSTSKGGGVGGVRGLQIPPK